MIHLRIPSPIGKNSLRHAETAVIVRALEREDENVPRAAKLLGIGTSTLYRRMQELGLQLMGRTNR